MPQQRDWFSQFEQPKPTDWFSQFEQPRISDDRSWIDRAIGGTSDMLDVFGRAAKDAWEWGSKPLFPIVGDIARVAAPFVMPGMNITERAVGMQPGDVSNLSGDFWAGMTSPINLTMAGLCAGEYSAARAGMAGLAKGLHGATKIASVPFIAEGAKHIAEQEGLLGKGLGALELVGGLAGVKAKPFPIRRPNLPTPTSVADAALSKNIQERIMGAEQPKPVTILDQFGKPIISDVPEAKSAIETASEVLTKKKKAAYIYDPDKGFILEGTTQKNKTIEPLKFNLAAKLPPDLSRASPRFNLGEKAFELKFNDDLDKALLIVAQTTKFSKRDADYLRFVMDSTGLGERESRALGIQLRTKIKDLLKTHESGVVEVPRLFDRIKNLIVDETGEFNPGNLWQGLKNLIRDESGELRWGSRIGKGGTPAEIQQAIQAGTPALDRIKAAIREAGPLRLQQEQIYGAERSARFKEMVSTPLSSEASLGKRLGALKGEYEKVTTAPIRNKLDQSDVDELLNMIGSSQIDEWEKTRAGVALAKLLDGKAVPQPGELELLEGVFGRDFTKSLNDAGFIRVPKIEGIKFTTELANLPRALMAAVDFSGSGRQGLGLIHRKEFWTSFDDMFKAWGSEKAFRGIQDSIKQEMVKNLVQTKSGKFVPLIKAAGLELTDIGKYAGREELFMSKIAEKIPLVRRSERAYIGFLNKLRFDTFNSLIADATKAGLNPKENMMLTREIAEYINNATGRGSLGGFEDSAVALNNFFFAPKLISSRVHMLNPATYVNASPFVRKQYLKSLISIAGAGATVLSIAKLAGAEIESNPNSADFGKARIGNVRLDPWGGFQQYLVAAHRLISGKVQSTTTGREYELGSRYGTPTKLDIAFRFGQSKLNPTVSFITTMMQQKDFAGAPINVKNEIVSRFIPIIIQDIYELQKEDPKLLPLAIPGIFGMGIQSYGMQGTELMQQESYAPRMGGNIRFIR